MKDSKTQRGFDYSTFKDLYGNECSLQKSSLATIDAVWLGVNEACPQIMVSKAKQHGLEPIGDCGWMPYPVPEDVLLHTRMHLSRKQVSMLLPYLVRFAETGALYET